MTSRWAFQLINESVTFSRADSFCRAQFSSLITADQAEEREGALELLGQSGLQSRVWVQTPKATLKPAKQSKYIEEMDITSSKTNAFNIK